jgi:hypothetical protein
MYKDKDTAEHALVGSFSFLRRFRNSGGQHRPKALEKIATARCRGGAELMVRFNFILSAAIGFVTALMLTTCASPSRVVWEYYDQCARENPSFLTMAECGRQRRLAECVPNNTCSPEGNMFMQYIDTLVLSVKKKELTEAEAMRRYTEYKAGGTPSHP